MWGSIDRDSGAKHSGAGSFSSGLKFLVVDDDATNRLVLASVLESYGFSVIHATDGVEGVTRFRMESPDFVLMDVMMPEMDGYEATKIIKSECIDRFVPVIFLTALHGEDELIRCIECGGDDFLSKPYSESILAAKIQSMLRLKKLNEELYEKNKKLEQWRIQETREISVAEKLYSAIVNRGCGNLDKSIRYVNKAVGILSGDLVVADRDPSGALCLMVSDFTGHGMGAALGSLSASDVFYAMVRKGFDVPDIIKELNTRLRSILPREMFIACALVRIDYANDTLSVWNAGMPDIVLKRKAGQETEFFPSRFAPLGVLPSGDLDIKSEVGGLGQGDRLYIISDGIIETRKKSGEMYGASRYLSVLNVACSGENAVQEIIEDAWSFKGDAAQIDDMTAVEVVYESGGSTYRTCAAEVEDSNSKAKRWGMSLYLDAETIGSVNPIPLLLHGISDIQGLNKHREKIHVILKELYMNAVDHGILGLRSTKKTGAEEFLQYYELRDKRLKENKSGWIRIEVEHNAEQESGTLHIKVEDSGEGFNFKRDPGGLGAHGSYAGRGIQMVKSIASTLEYVGRGNIAQATYEWK